MKNRTCTIDGCGKKHYSRGLCRAHYSRVQREQRKARTDKPCLSASRARTATCRGTRGRR